jgi:GGDEF domain-containing protein
VPLTSQENPKASLTTRENAADSFVKPAELHPRLAKIVSLLQGNVADYQTGIPLSPEIDLATARLTIFSSFKDILGQEEGFRQLRKLFEYWQDSAQLKDFLRQELDSREIKSSTEYFQTLINDRIFQDIFLNNLKNPFFPCENLAELKNTLWLNFAFAFKEYSQKRDPLTRMWRRETLEPYFIEQVARNGKIPLLIFVDLNNFKKINDRYGHEAGDRILQLFAAAIRRSFEWQNEDSLASENPNEGNAAEKSTGRRARSNDLALRWGGDEFVLLFLLDELNEHNKESVSNSIQEVMHEIFLHFQESLRALSMIDPQDLENISFCFGYYADKRKLTEPEAQMTLQIWLAKADQSLQEAKERKNEINPPESKKPDSSGEFII